MSKPTQVCTATNGSGAYCTRARGHTDLHYDSSNGTSWWRSSNPDPYDASEPIDAARLAGALHSLIETVNRLDCDMSRASSEALEQELKHARTALAAWQEGKPIPVPWD